MKKLCVFLVLPLLAGCLTSTVTPPAYWPLDYTGPVSAAKSPKYGVARCLPVVVRSPYASAQVAVLRADGTVAFDPLNEFATTPANLLRGPAQDAVAASGLFREVVGSESIAAAEVSVEVTVSRLALDCREEGKREALVELNLRILRGHEIVSSVKGTGKIDAANGNYGSAFSVAFVRAFVSAFSQMR